MAASSGLSRFLEHTRCPRPLVEECLAAVGAAAASPAARPAASAPAPPTGGPQAVRAWIERFLQAEPSSPLAWESDAVLDLFHWERYIDNRIPDPNARNLKSIVRKLYYLLRPLFPVAFRKHLQRAALKGWDKAGFPVWPVDFSCEDILDQTMRRLLRAGVVNELPFIWYWPEDHPACCIMTHDVETAAGRDFCSTLMKMEAEYAIVSAFELVPEQRYDVPAELLHEIWAGGCEVCVHGLNHDGNLFSSEAVFNERAPKINNYAKAWGATGFRSPVLYRNLEWFGGLNFSYDMSVPNLGHLDPQRGGCCTVRPYFIGDLLELPLTTIQDYSLYNILQQRSLDLWQRQSQLILERNGLISFIIHPDYTTAPWAQQLYRSLLAYLAELRDRAGVWLALPREVDQWWRQRNQLSLENEAGRWRVRGPHAQRARVAFASLEGDRLVYRFEPAGS